MRFDLAAILAILLVALPGCGPVSSPEPAKVAAAKIENPVAEESLTTLTLTTKAIERLGIATVPLVEKQRDRRRRIGGEVIIPPGQLIVVAAPLAGTLSPPMKSEMPLPGTQLTSGQTVFSFLPLLTPERDVLAPADRVRVAQTKVDLAAARIDADRQLASAKVQVDLANTMLERAKQLLANKAGSQRTVDEATSQYQLAQEAQTAATARSKFLADIQLDEAAGQLQSRPIVSPVAGVLQRIDAAPGETVAAGKVLFQVARLDRLWVRVPIYVGQRAEIDLKQEALVSEFGETRAAPRSAKYAAAPPSADPVAATIDLFYELDNQDGSLQPGQKLAIALPLKSQNAFKIVPKAAIVYDSLGGTWIYEQTGKQTFVRRRVEVTSFEGNEALLSAGPAAGRSIVIAAAAELFGTEFGIGK